VPAVPALFSDTDVRQWTAMEDELVPKLQRALEVAAKSELTEGDLERLREELLSQTREIVGKAKAESE